MLRRFFNALFTLCGMWIAFLIWNRGLLIETLTLPIFLILAVGPLGFVWFWHYVFIPRDD